MARDIMKMHLTLPLALISITLFHHTDSMCNKMTSQDKTALIGHVIETYFVDGMGACADYCTAETLCKSMNFYPRTKKCETNSARIDSSGDKEWNEESVYFENVDKGGPPQPSTALECNNYITLNDPTRNIDYLDIVSDEKTDAALTSAWYRFALPAGTRLPQGCVPRYRCGTGLASWMYGSDPSVEDGAVKRTVMFGDKGFNCCEAKVSIMVRNCSSYLVYKLGSTPHARNLRYCSV